MKKFVKGMHKDSERVDQPEGTYRDALNANLYYSKGAIVNEEGTIKLGTFPIQPIGAIPLINAEVLVFGWIYTGSETTPDFTEGSKMSGIMLVNTKSNSSRILYMSEALNFQRTHPIVGEFKVDNKNEIIAYFTDNYYIEEDTPEGKALSEYNSPRAFNVSRQLEFVKGGGDYNILYDADENFDVKKLDLFASVGKHSVIEKVNVYEGGVLVTGAYHLALCYSDENFLETDYFVVSNPVYIVPGKEQSYPADGMIGAEAGTQTNKSIEFFVRIFSNNNYKFLQPAIIQRVGNAEFAHKLERIEMDPNGDDSQISITYTGREDTATGSVDDIIIDNVKYLTAKTLTQLDNRLYLANLRSRKDIGFQRYANNIRVRPATSPFSNFDIRVFDVQSLNKGYAMMILPYGKTSNMQGAEFGIGQTYYQKQSSSGTSMGFVEGHIRRTYFEGIFNELNYGDGATVGTHGIQADTYSLTGKVAKGYKDFRFSFKNKSFRRGEVYAFYISFVLRDGTETYAYHIPGRPPRTTAQPKPVTETSTFGESAGNWNDIKNKLNFYPSEVAKQDPQGRVYQYIDTSMVEFATGQTYNMGYWENANETYPFTPDFQGGGVNNDGTTYNSTSLRLVGENVRHHRMPSNHNTDFSFIQTQNATTYYGSHQALFNDTFTSLQYMGSGFHLSYRNAENVAKKLVTKDPIRLLGIKLENIKIPRHILKKVQGYKIYYAKRKDEDKLVAGQSLAVPAHPRYASVPTQNKLLARKGPFKNAFYLYGGLEGSDANAMDIRAEWKGAWQTTDQYIGHPVFTFHDFNMLRKRPTLEGLTHVSCQSAVVFRTYSGGPGVFAKPADYDELVPDDAGDNVQTQEGLGTAIELTTFPSLGWIHPDLGNTTDFDQDGLVIDITDNFIDLAEDVANPYGYETEKPNRRRRRGRRKDRNKNENPDKVRDDALRIKHWRGAVNIAAKYLRPGDVSGVLEVVKGGSNPVNGWNKHWDDGESLPNQQYIFRIDPKSRIYARGQANIEVPESTSFSGAQVLYNRGGESSIVIGMTSGLPHLKGYRLFESNYYNDANSAWDIVKWHDDVNFLFPDAFYWKKLPKRHYEDNPDYGSLEDARKAYRGYNYILDALRNQYDGYPMAWLVNLESAKTDVYNPFDRQELVWTGYYHAINPREVGGEVVGLDTGECLDDYGSSENYYDGAESDKIFGGDTYITRYSFRTTSHSYGHCYFRGAINLGDPGSEADDGNPANNFHVQNGNKDRFQADLPDIYNHLNPNEWGGMGPMSIWTDGNNILNVGSSDEKIFAASKLINQTANWVQGDSDPVATLFSFMVESDDNIGFRHKVDIDKGVTTKFFDGDIASEVLFAPPTEDLTKQDNLLYEDHYSALQDIRVAVPYPKRKPANDDITSFGNRVIRSNNAAGAIGDKYRQFLANEYKDLPKNKGDIWNLFTFGGLLVIHTERSMFKTQGKENLAVGDVTAFIGSGNIFAQEPEELRDTKNGYGGTTSILGGVSTPYGRYWVSREDRKVYSYTGQIQEVVNGMEGWFRENMPFAIEQYGVNVDSPSFDYDPDATTAPAALGFATAYDSKYKRLIVTKREPVPTQAFRVGWAKGELDPTVLGAITMQDNTFYLNVRDQEFNVIVKVEINLANQEYFAPGGWTLSYYPELQVWGSRHSYIPRFYTTTADTLLSFSGSNAWAHTNTNEPGNFYGTTYPFEFEFIDNTAPVEAKAFTSISYWADVVKRDDRHKLQSTNVTSSGFTSFYVYNTTQVSALSTTINYLSNARKVDKIWYINSFRDLAKYTDQTNDFINSGKASVVDTFITKVNAPISSEPMFTSEGTVNPAYIDSTKPWFLQKKFVDHYMGVRLSNDNTSKDLVYLYAAGTKFRKSYR